MVKIFHAYVILLSESRKISMKRLLCSDYHQTPARKCQCTNLNCIILLIFREAQHYDSNEALKSNSKISVPRTGLGP